MTEQQVRLESAIDSEHRRLHDEHCRLQAEIDELRKWWCECREYGSPHFGEMGTRVSLLRGRLAEHFAWEEAGGYLHEIFAAAPEFAVRAESLGRQHASLLAEFDRLVADLRALEPPFGSWSEAGDRFEGLLVRLERHESAETELIQQTVRQAVGTKD